MANRWQDYQQKFSTLSSREQVMISATGLVAIIFIGFSFFIEPLLQQAEKNERSIKTSTSTIKATQATVDILNQGLTKDPNKRANLQLKKIEAQMKQIDAKLLTLTTELISPIQMRVALQELLRSDKRVSLLSFEIAPATPVVLSGEVENKSDDNKVSLSKVNIAEDKRRVNFVSSRVNVNLIGKLLRLARLFKSVRVVKVEVLLARIRLSVN